MLPRVILTSQGGVLNAAVLGEASRGVPETPTDQPERCIRQFVLNVARILRFPSGPVAISRSTVVIASAQ